MFKMYKFVLLALMLVMRWRQNRRYRSILGIKLRGKNPDNNIMVFINSVNQRLQSMEGMKDQCHIDTYVLNGPELFGYGK